MSNRAEKSMTFHEDALATRQIRMFDRRAQCLVHQRRYNGPHHTAELCMSRSKLETVPKSGPCNLRLVWQTWHFCAALIYTHQTRMHPSSMSKFWSYAGPRGLASRGWRMIRTWGNWWSGSSSSSRTSRNWWRGPASFWR